MCVCVCAFVCAETLPFCFFVCNACSVARRCLFACVCVFGGAYGVLPLPVYACACGSPQKAFRLSLQVEVDRQKGKHTKKKGERGLFVVAHAALERVTRVLSLTYLWQIPREEPKKGSFYILLSIVFNVEQQRKGRECVSVCCRKWFFFEFYFHVKKKKNSMHGVVELSWSDRKDVYTFGYRSGRFFHRCTYCSCPVKGLACGGMSACFREEHCSDAAYGVGKYTHASQKSARVIKCVELGRKKEKDISQLFFCGSRQQNETRRKKLFWESGFFLCSHFGVFILDVFGYHELYPREDGCFRLVLSFDSLISGSFFLFSFPQQLVMALFFVQISGVFVEPRQWFFRVVFFFFSSFTTKNSRAMNTVCLFVYRFFNVPSPLHTHKRKNVYLDVRRDYRKRRKRRTPHPRDCSTKVDEEQGCWISPSATPQ